MRCLICGVDLSGQPAAQDRVTGLYYCQLHPALIGQVDAADVASCPHCGFRYSKIHSTFLSEVESRCPSCGKDLFETDVADKTVATLLAAIEEWMDLTPAGNASDLIERLDYIGDPQRQYFGGWGVDWGSGNRAEILQILKECLIEDLSGRSNVTLRGDPEKDQLGDLPVSPGHDSWEHVAGSMLEILAGLNLHYLTKLDSDLYALLVHEGTISHGFQGTNKAAAEEMAARAKAEWRATQPDVGTLTSASDIAQLITALGHEDYSISVPARDSLVRIGAPAVDALIEALDDTDRGVRLNAVIALRELRDRKAVDRLIAAIHDDDDTVRRQAVTALGELGDERAVDPLIHCLRDAENDGFLAGHAAEALGRLRDPRAESALIEAFESDYYHPRARAGPALGKLGTERAREVLERAFGQQDRFPATIGLAFMGKTQAVTQLQQAVSSTRDDQGAAAIALAELRDSAAFDLVVAALRKADYSRSGYLVEALVELGDPRAAGPLVELAQRESYRTLDVIHALKQLGGEAAIDYLISMLNSGDYRYHAVNALATVGDARAVEPLREVIARSDCDGATKQRALEAVERIEG